MARRTHRHDPGLVRGGERIVQPDGEREVAEMVCGELHLVPARRHGQLRHRHHPGVVDQDVERPGPGPDEGRDAGQVAEVDGADARRARCRCCPGSRRRRDRRTRCCRTASVTDAPAAASARAVSTPIPDEAPVTIAVLPVRSTPCDDVGCRRFETERCGDAVTHGDRPRWRWLVRLRARCARRAPRRCPVRPPSRRLRRPRPERSRGRRGRRPRGTRPWPHRRCRPRDPARRR